MGRHHRRDTLGVPALARVPVLREGILRAVPGRSAARAIADRPLASAIPEFVAHVLDRGAGLYRDLPWRRTTDPYAVLLSEVMLQQTQVPRVLGKWEAWLAEFPTLEALAAAPLPPHCRAPSRAAAPSHSP